MKLGKGLCYFEKGLTFVMLIEHENSIVQINSLNEIIFLRCFLSPEMKLKKSAPNLNGRICCYSSIIFQLFFFLSKSLK